MVLQRYGDFIQLLDELGEFVVANLVSAECHALAMW
jgi:hypothetical protein